MFPLGAFISTTIQDSFLPSTDLQLLPRHGGGLTCHALLSPLGLPKSHALV